jgi:hypothetical protein
MSIGADPIPAFEPHETVTSPAHDRHERLVRRLAGVAVVGVLVYVLLDIVAQVLPPHYNPITQAESDLAVGPYGYVMTVNFVIRGVFSSALLVAMAIAMKPTTRSRIGLAFWSLWALGAFILARFATDLGATEHSLHGKIHVSTALIAFVAATVGEILLSRCLYAEARWRQLGRRATWISMSTLVTLILFGPLTRAGAGGLIERLFLASILVWVLVIATGLYRGVHDMPLRGSMHQIETGAL